MATANGARLPTELDGFRLLEPIGQGAHSIVYRAQRGDDFYALKLATNIEEGSQTFRREAATLARIKHAGVVRVVTTGCAPDGHPFVAMELLDGDSLEIRLARSRLGISETIDLGCRLSSALTAVHGRGLVHRDLKPANILIDSAGMPRIVDFGLAAQRRREPGNGQQQAVGTFRYSAPEQAGALSLAVDGRADLYSMGVLLYECLAGDVPFTADDPGELIHMHAVAEPEELRTHRAEVPRELSRVVHRLLAKDPSDRFATARDLERALAALRNPGAAPSVSLPPPSSMTPRSDAAEPMVQRETELGALSNAHRRAVSGRGQMVLLRARPGMGRGRLVQALADRLEGSTVLRATASDSDVPYGTLRTALSPWFAAMREEDQLDAAVDSAVGELRGPLSRALPEVGREPQGAAESDSEEDDELVVDAVSQLLLGVARQNGGLSLILEHAESLDSATLALLGQLSGMLADVPLLVVISGNESDELAPLATAVRSHGHTLLTPAALDRSGVSKLVHDYLNSEFVSDELVDQLVTRCQGRPAAVVAHLDALIACGALTPHWGKWQLDDDAFERVDLPEDFTEIAIRRLDDLDPAARQLISIGAVLGRSFSVSDLASLSEQPEESVGVALQPACELGLLQAASGELRFLDAGPRQAAYEELDEAQRSRLHRAAAKLESGDDSGSLYRRAHHGFRGLDASNAGGAFEDNCAAAEHAMSCQATEAACQFFDQAQAIAEPHGLKLSPTQVTRRAEALATLGELDTALELLTETSRGDGDPIERATASLRAGELCLWTVNDVSGADAHIDAAWQTLEHPRPRGGLGALFHALWLIFLVFIAERFGRGYGDRKDDPRTRLLWKLSEQTGGLHFFRLELGTVMYLSVWTAYQATRLGPSRELGMALAARANTFSAFGLPKPWAAKCRERAIAMGKQLDDRKVEARAELMFSTGLSFRGELVEARERLMVLLDKEWRWLDVNDLILAQMDIVGSLGATGYIRESDEQARRFLQRLGTRLGGSDQRSTQIADAMALNATVTGGTEDAGRALERMIGELGPLEEDSFRWFLRWTSALAHRQETGQGDAAIDEAADALHQLNLQPGMAAWQMGSRWSTELFARFTQWLEAPPQDKKKRQQQLEWIAAEIAKLRPEIWKSHISIARAMVAMAQGDLEKCLVITSEAERIAEHGNNAAGLWESRKLRARALRLAGDEAACQHTVTQLLSLAESLGYWGRIPDVAKEFGMAPPSRRGAGGRTAVTRATTGLTSSLRGHRLVRDRDALLEVSLAGAGHLDPEAHANACIDTLINVLDAERGCLFLTGKDGELGRFCGRDANGADLADTAVIAESLVKRAFREQEPLVLSGSEEGEALGSISAVAENLRSIICAPVTLRGERLGVVYLDNRLARGVFSANDLDILLAVGNQMAIGQQTAKSAQHEIERRALAKDLQLGRAVQHLLLPEVAEEASERVAWAACYEPASHVGGDWWYRDTRPDGRLRIALGDVTGHGAAAAMVTAAAAGCYRSVLVENADVSSETLLHRLQDTLQPICRGQHGMTFVIAEIAPDGTFEWVSAGAPPVVQLQADGRTRIHGGASTPLGYERFVIKRGQGKLGHGDRLLVFSDGLTELQLQNGKELGLRRVRNLLVDCKSLSLFEAREHMQREANRLRGGAEPDDDLTFVLVETALG